MAVHVFGSKRKGYHLAEWISIYISTFMDPCLHVALKYFLKKAINHGRRCCIAGPIFRSGYMDATNVLVYGVLSAFGERAGCKRE